MPRKITRNRPGYPALYSPAGQVRTVRAIFSKNKVSAIAKSAEDPRTFRNWMRNEIRPEIEKRVKATLYAQMPANTSHFVYVGDARGFVEELAQTSFGNKSQESLALAHKKALKLADVMMRRAERMKAATNNINTPKKKWNIRVTKKRSYIANTKDAFGQILIETEFIDMFRSELARLRL